MRTFNIKLSHTDAVLLRSLLQQMREMNPPPGTRAMMDHVIAALEGVKDEG